MKNVSIYILLLSFLIANSVNANEFPGRSQFPDQEIIEIDDLYKHRDKMIIIDTRTDFEYNVIHINNAVHVNFESEDYIDRLKSIRKTDRRKMIFYCNGLTCTKAFRAHKAATEAGIRNTATFDAGVFTWANAYPNEAMLMGKSPVDPSKLLSREALKSRLLDAERFSEKVSSDSVVLDVRDESQREATRLYPLYQRNFTLDDPKLPASIKKAVAEGKTVLIYDYTGQQVRWLQYLLESLNVRDYYFLKGGFRGFLGL